MRNNNNSFDPFEDKQEVSWRDPNRYYEIISKLREEFLHHWSNENPIGALLKLQALHNTIFSYIIRSGRIKEFRNMFGTIRKLILDGNYMQQHEIRIMDENYAKAHAMLGFVHQQIDTFNIFFGGQIVIIPIGVFYAFIKYGIRDVLHIKPKAPEGK